EIKKYYAKQYALNNLCLTSLGYSGYNNAKFGRIDAHIGVCAWDRKILLDATRIAERSGFKLIHGIVDSLWLKRQGAEEEDYKRLRREIEVETGFALSFEGIYTWVVFLQSRGPPRVHDLHQESLEETRGVPQQDDPVLGGGSARGGGHRVARGGKRKVLDHRLLFGVAAEASCPGVAHPRWNTVRRKKVRRVAGRGLLDCSGTIRREMLPGAARRQTSGHAALFLSRRGDVRIFCALCQTSLSGSGISAFAHETAGRDN